MSFSLSYCSAIVLSLLPSDVFASLVLVPLVSFMASSFLVFNSLYDTIQALSFVLYFIVICFLIVLECLAVFLIFVFPSTFFVSLSLRLPIVFSDKTQAPPLVSYCNFIGFSTFFLWFGVSVKFISLFWSFFSDSPLSVPNFSFNTAEIPLSLLFCNLAGLSTCDVSVSSLVMVAFSLVSSLPLSISLSVMTQLLFSVSSCIITEFTIFFVSFDVRVLFIEKFSFFFVAVTLSFPIF